MSVKEVQESFNKESFVSVMWGFTVNIKGHVTYLQYEFVLFKEWSLISISWELVRM